MGIRHSCWAFHHFENARWRAFGEPLHKFMDYLQRELQNRIQTMKATTTVALLKE
jgi:hypothetical protein